MSFKYDIMQSINTSLLSLIALILLMAAYFGFGVHVRMLQTIGSFMVIVGSLCMYIALSSGSHDDSAGDLVAEGSSGGSGHVATPILGLNTIAAVCLSGLFIILKINH